MIERFKKWPVGIPNTLWVATVMLLASNLTFADVKHDTTIWEIKPSLKYDALCFLNTLTGDTFYKKYYNEEYTLWSAKMDNQTKAALDSLYRKFKVENQSIISAFYCLYFSVVEDSTLNDLIKTTLDPSILHRNFKKTSYYNVGAWNFFISGLPHLRQVLTFLNEHGFEGYWKNNIALKVTGKMEKIYSVFSAHNIIPQAERLLGRPLPSDTIVVHMLYFSQPHGIKVWGTEFLTDIAWPAQIVLRNAVHEMMHPSLNSKNNKLNKLINRAYQDEFLLTNFENRNPVFGYNTEFGLIEEDCVQAMEQLINEKLKISVEARKRWLESDNGLHKFAAILYSQMKKDDYLMRPGKGIEFYLIKLLKKRNRYHEIYNHFYNTITI